MAIIAQKEIFSWEQIDTSSDLDRLRMALAVMPDEKLMRELEARRSGKRDDYPIRAVWNSIVAGIVFQHCSVESLRRELLRNGELRAACGFLVLKGDLAVPPASVYTRFLQRLFKYEHLINEMFDNLVEQLRRLLPGFGKRLGIDSKGVKTHARSKKATEEAPAEDGRRDTDANWGVKRYRGQREDGTLWEKVKKAVMRR